MWTNFHTISKKMNIFEAKSAFSKDRLLAFAVITRKMTYFNKITEKYQFFQPNALPFAVITEKTVYFHKISIFNR